MKSSVAFFSSGRRRAFLSSMGNVPCFSDVFIRSDRIGDSSCMTSLSRSIGIGSNSQLLDGAFITYLAVSSMLTCLNFLSVISSGRSDISGGVSDVFMSLCCILKQLRSFLIFCILSVKKALKSLANSLLELHVGRGSSWLLPSKVLHIQRFSCSYTYFHLMMLCKSLSLQVTTCLRPCNIVYRTNGSHWCLFCLCATFSLATFFSWFHMLGCH